MPVKKEGINLRVQKLLLSLLTGKLNCIKNTKEKTTFIWLTLSSKLSKPQTVEHEFVSKIEFRETFHVEFRIFKLFLDCTKKFFYFNPASCFINFSLFLISRNTLQSTAYPVSYVLNS